MNIKKALSEIDAMYEEHCCVSAYGLKEVIKALGEAEEKEFLCYKTHPIKPFCCGCYCHDNTKDDVQKKNHIREVYDKYKDNRPFHVNAAYMNFGYEMWQAIKQHCEG